VTGCDGVEPADKLGARGIRPLRKTNINADADTAALGMTAMKKLENIVADVPLEEPISICIGSEFRKTRCDELMKQAEARIKMATLPADGGSTCAAPLSAEI
jgi:exodeoxyribonuclease VII small subunit